MYVQEQLFLKNEFGESNCTPSNFDIFFVVLYQYLWYYTKGKRCCRANCLWKSYTKVSFLATSSSLGCSLKFYQKKSFSGFFVIITDFFTFALEENGNLYGNWWLLLIVPFIFCYLMLFYHENWKIHKKWNLNNLNFLYISLQLLSGGGSHSGSYSHSVFWKNDCPGLHWLGKAACGKDVLESINSKSNLD